MHSLKTTAVRSVLPDKPGGDLPEVAVGEVPRRGDRAKEEIRAHEQREQPRQLDREPRLCRLVARERERRPLPEEGVAGPAEDVESRRGSRSRDRDGGHRARNMAVKSSGTRHSADFNLPGSWRT